MVGAERLPSKIPILSSNSEYINWKRQAKKFDKVWWWAAKHAEYLMQTPDIETECSDLLYLITHLVYVQTAYMTIQMDPVKVGQVLVFIQKQKNEHFIDVECEINLNNVELLVELADFVRAVGFLFLLPRDLLRAFAQVRSSQMLL